MKISEKLRNIRTKEKNLTLKKLSEGTGISLPYLSEIERGISQPTVLTLEKIAKFYNLTLSEILSGANNDEEINLNTLSKGLVELVEDEKFKDFFADENGKQWIKTLQKVEYRGSQPETKEEWANLFLYLKNVLNGKQ